MTECVNNVTIAHSCVTNKGCNAATFTIQKIPPNINKSGD